METRLEAKLIECLSALDQGESIDQVLARYPDDAPQLRRLLLTAQALPSLRLEPSEAMKLKSREAAVASGKMPQSGDLYRVAFLRPYARTDSVVFRVEAEVKTQVAEIAASPGEHVHAKALQWTAGGSEAGIKIVERGHIRVGISHVHCTVCGSSDPRRARQIARQAGHLRRWDLRLLLQCGLRRHLRARRRA